jgi:hypothetical protein
MPENFLQVNFMKSRQMPVYVSVYFISPCKKR